MKTGERNTSDNKTDVCNNVPTITKNNLKCYIIYLII